MARRDLERGVKSLAYSAAARLLGPRQARPLPRRVARVLVTKQHNQLGDFILATPLIASLARAFPGAAIDYLASPLQAEAAGLVPEIRHVWLLPGRGLVGRGRHVAALIRGLRRERYDLAIGVMTVSFSTTSALLLALSGARYRVAGRIAKSPRGASLFDMEVPIPIGIHETDRALAHLACLGISPAVREPRLVLPQNETETARLRLSAARWGSDELVIGLHPGAGKAPNRWPPAAFGELAQRLLRREGVRIILFAGPREEPLLDAMRLAPGPRIVRLTGLSLRSLAAFIRCLTIYVGNDTGTLHLAAGLGVPTVGLFGPTDPEIWAPIASRGRVLRAASGVTCDIRVDDVERAVEEGLSALFSERPN